MGKAEPTSSAVSPEAPGNHVCRQKGQTCREEVEEVLGKNQIKVKIKEQTSSKEGAEAK